MLMHRPGRDDVELMESVEPKVPSESCDLKKRLSQNSPRRRVYGGLSSTLSIGSTHRGIILDLPHGERAALIGRGVTERQDGIPNLYGSIYQGFEHPCDDAGSHYLDCLTARGF